MKISERWLREWVDPELSSEQLLHKLTMAGLEVDGAEAAGGSFTGVVVGQVLDVEPHPAADKLQICRVSDGSSSFQVVCGARNVRQGMKVPFAMIGARLDADFVIKAAKLRGVESHGMLCSAAELGMVEEAEGLLELPAEAPLGCDVRDYLQLADTLIEVDLTPNRGDCLSIAGLAREVAVLTRATLNKPVFLPIPAVIVDQLPITLQSPEACPRYLGRIIRDINPDAETPLWMQEKLRRGGLRCIDPVVDVTNFVLLELGQPLHAFDLAKLEGGIHVRQAVAGEKLLLLDGKEVQLNPDTLIIADESKALAMAGVMGGKDSAVGPRTQDIFLESAFFSPLVIAGRARRYGMHTDAAHRYERGVDFNLAPLAMERATALLLDIVGGKPGPVVESRGELPEVAPVLLRRQRLEQVLGIALPQQEILDILTSLGLKLLSEVTGGWVFAVPSWRFDISIEVDLIEEVARVYGYDRLPVRGQSGSLSLQAQPETELSLRSIRNLLCGLAYQEVVTYSFVPPDLNAALGAVAEESLTLANPISQDMASMRTSLWPGLLKTLVHNQNRQQGRARLFETGLVFSFKNKQIEQKVKVGCLLCGSYLPEQWGSPAREVDFFDLKGDAELVLGLTHAAEQFRFEAASHEALQPGQSARILRAGVGVGWIGALHPALLQALDIKGKVFLLELDFASIREARVSAVSELSRFPAVRRDLALVLDQVVTAEAVQELLKEVAGAELQELHIFDLYQGASVENGKKSLALGLTFQHPSRTLTDLEINPIIDSCIKALEAKFNAELR
jgi:phenylalanyl-tRNA synthetase beta chain